MQGWLQVGYATYYTTAPVFSLVLDVELPERVVFMFPELYQTLRNGRVLSIKTFFCWLWKSIYQVRKTTETRVTRFSPEHWVHSD